MEDKQDCACEVVGRMTRDEAGDVLPTEPGAEHGHTDVSGDYLSNDSECGTYLTGPEDDPVLVLRPVVLVVLQLLPLDAHSHRSQLLIHTKVIGML